MPRAGLASGPGVGPCTSGCPFWGHFPVLLGHCGNVTWGSRADAFPRLYCIPVGTLHPDPELSCPHAVPRAEAMLGLESLTSCLCGRALPLSCRSQGHRPFPQPHSSQACQVPGVPVSAGSGRQKDPAVGWRVPSPPTPVAPILSSAPGSQGSAPQVSSPRAASEPEGPDVLVQTLSFSCGLSPSCGCFLLLIPGFHSLLSPPELWWWWTPSQPAAPWPTHHWLSL